MVNHQKREVLHITPRSTKFFFPQNTLHLSKKADAPVEIAFKHALFHEIAHSFSSNRVREDREADINYSESGYAQYTREGDSYPDASNDYLNEGVTDLIAKEKMQEYLRRKGLSQHVEAAERVSAITRKHPKRRVLKLIELISEKSGVDQGHVWGAMKQGYYSGLNVESAEFVEGVAETLDIPDLTEFDAIFQKMREMEFEDE